MKLKGWLFILAVLLGITLFFSYGLSKNKELPPEFSTYGGKLFKGIQDPEFQNYDLVLRNHLVRRIHKNFGIELDPKNYSGFDLLEIEALAKCKKSDESLDIILKMFPRSK